MRQVGTLCMHRGATQGVPWVACIWCWGFISPCQGIVDVGGSQLEAAG